MNIRSTIVWALSLVALVPLLSFDGLFYPFMLSKALAFKALVIIALAFFAFSVARGDKWDYSPLRSKVMLLPLGFVAVQALATIFGADPYHSFWSLFDRMDGLVMIVHAAFFTYLAALVFEKAHWLRFWKLVVGTGGVIALYALGQAFGLQGLILSGSDRVVGTIGNAAFLASYLTLTGFIALYLAGLTSGKARVAWQTIAALSLVAIILSGTRGAFVGLAAAAACAIAIALWKGSRRTRRIAGGALAVSILTLAGIFVFRDTLKDSSLRPLARVASISLEDATTKSRLFVWSNTLKAIPENPLLGVGPENFEIVYNKFFDPQVVSEEWFDRAHNMYLDVAATSGLLGLASYLSILAALGLSLRRKIAEEGVVALPLAPGFVAYLVQNVFVFDAISTHIIFWALIAWLLSVPRSGAMRAAQLPWKVAGSILALGAVASLYWTSWLPLQANVALSKAYKYQIVDSALSDETLVRGLSYNTFAHVEYGYQMYNMYFTKRVYPNFPPQQLRASFDIYRAHMEQLVERYPHNVRHLIYLGHLYEGRPAGVMVDEAAQEAMLRRAIELSPMRPQPHYMLANIHLARSAELSGTAKSAEVAKAVEILKAYSDSVPQFAEAAAIYGTVLFNNGRQPEAVEPMSRAMEYFDGDPSVAKRIVSYLLRSGRAADTESFLEVVVAAEVTNYEAAFDLAKVYSTNKKHGKAIEMLNILQEKAPTLLEREPFNVQQILRGYNAGRAL